VVIEGALLLAVFLGELIYLISMVARNFTGTEYIGFVGGVTLATLLFALLILIPAAKQLNTQKANRKNQSFVMILACFTVNFFGIVFIAIGMSDENRYLIHSEQCRYDNVLLTETL